MAGIRRCGRNTSNRAEVDLLSGYDCKTTRIKFSAHLPLARISAARGFAGRHPSSIDRTRSGKAPSSLEPMPRSIDAAFLTPPNNQLKPSSGDNSYRAGVFAGLGSFLYGYDLNILVKPAVSSHSFNDMFNPSTAEIGLVIYLLAAGVFVGAGIAARHNIYATVTLDHCVAPAEYRGNSRPGDGPSLYMFLSSFARGGPLA
ncbi:hypothetical protein BGZ61DRAFT_482292 [Ilyonectria robusta]|uniref:uncharacterized protein n=1 Tax=Ilyonectria robusta TaxID=1079257 RepID=UPI001E8EAE11|nr:uncharacterized protein BGZ61DRAFT_482292 [Ilyonectria robusta]KAH8673029.1 hypothetical protein BGZ61DRAFT_482292 [Ilyonectria robusta]